MDPTWHFSLTLCNPNTFSLNSTAFLAALFAHLSFDLKSPDNLAALFDFNVDSLSFIWISSDSLVALFCASFF